MGFLFACLLLACPIPATCLHAQDDEAAADALRKTMLDLDLDDDDKKKAAIESLAQSGDVRLIKFFEDYDTGGSVFIWKGRAVMGEEQADKEFVRLLDPLTREPIQAEAGTDLVFPKRDLKEVDVGRQERKWSAASANVLRLSNPDRDKRLAAVVKCGDLAKADTVPALKQLLEKETEKKVRFAIRESLLLIDLSAPPEDPGALEKRLEAARELGELCSGRALITLNRLATESTDAQTLQIYQTAIDKIVQWQAKVRAVGHLYSGLSTGSILVLMALGLSIIFGVMGVINMAHGELMMIGAYTTLLTQYAFEALIKDGLRIFGHTLFILPPGAYEYYVLVAIPLSFAAAALVGFLIELLVVRHLYGRPLDTLLATWGVSLILIQAIRYNFGDNRGVNSPKWLQGGAEVAQDIVLPYNRLFIMAFCVLCILLMYFIIEHTKLGLLLRATTQNRSMAAALGVPTRRIDGYTFALGAGLAGLAGCALSQVGGVTPDMGQNYIVESFMVVVTGGVGKLAGAIWAGLGLGILIKIFEPWVETVWAKVLMLGCVVLFIQWRPSGLFPAKGRAADV